MPRGSSSETLPSICSRSKVCPTTRSTDRLLWHMLGPSVGPRGRWESDSFLAYHFPHHSVREMLVSGDFRPVCVVKTRKSHEGENSNHYSGTLYWPIAWTAVKLFTLFCSDTLVDDFDWLVLFCVLLFFLLFLSSCLSFPLFTLQDSGYHISHCIPKTLIVILLLFEGKTPQADRRQSTIHPQDPG